MKRKDGQPASRPFSAEEVKFIQEYPFHPGYLAELAEKFGTYGQRIWNIRNNPRYLRAHQIAEGKRVNGFTKTARNKAHEALSKVGPDGLTTYQRNALIWGKAAIVARHKKAAEKYGVKLSKWMNMTRKEKDALRFKRRFDPK